jgi:cystathionine beta-lyase/cystathionine gamma-synthase
LAAKRLRLAAFSVAHGPSRSARSLRPCDACFSLAKTSPTFPAGTVGVTAARAHRSRQGLGTRAVHPKPQPPQDGAPVAPVLDQSSTYHFSDAGSFAKASEAKVGAGYVYTRWANPTIDALKSAVADLEGTEDAEAFASGMGAISGVFLGLCSPGDRVVAARQLYGGTYSLLSSFLPRYGIDVDFFNVDDLAGIRGRVAGAKLLYCETIGNPRIQVADLPELASIAESAHVPLIVDNTFASPILCRPAEHGASLVVHSATKFLGGHHDLLGGVACGSPAMIEPIRATARDMGATLAPFNAWLALRGIATVHLRVRRACESALAIAEALEARSDIDTVHYPALASSPDKRLADALLGGRGGGTLAFEIASGRDRAARFQETLQLIMPAASLGGSHSLIVHAASVTHTQLSSDELAAAGISEGFCRLSVGLEDADDLIADLLQALDATA